MSDTQRSSELMARASQFLAGGTMHHTTHGALPQELQPIVARGEGSRFWDVDGKEYIDYVMGSGPLILGHAHPEVVEAAEKQAAAGSQYYNLSESMIDLAETIVSAVPCGQRIKFAGSGNEATMMALRLARAVTGKPKIMKMEGGYHGTHDYTAWGGTHKEPFDYPHPPRDSQGIPDALADLVLVAPFNDIETTSRLIERNKNELAAVIVEPVQRNIPPKVEFLEGLRDVTLRCDVVLIFDEVVTGFRLAWGGGQEYYGVSPDLATMGKVIGGGYPIGAIVGQKDLFYPFTPEAAARGEAAMYGGTFSGNPASMAAGRATLDVLRRPGQYERLANDGQEARGRAQGVGPDARDPNVRVSGRVDSRRTVHRPACDAIPGHLVGGRGHGKKIQDGPHPARCLERARWSEDVRLPGPLGRGHRPHSRRRRGVSERPAGLTLRKSYFHKQPARHFCGGRDPGTV